MKSEINCFQKRKFVFQKAEKLDITLYFNPNKLCKEWLIDFQKNVMFDNNIKPIIFLIWSAKIKGSSDKFALGNFNSNFKFNS